MDGTDLNLPRDTIILPQNIEVEQALLGALLIDNTQLDRLPDQFLSTDFFVPVHGRIFEALSNSVGRGLIATPASIKPIFLEDEGMESAGGTSYLDQLAVSAITTIYAPDYAKQVIDLSKRRALVELHQDGLERALDPSVDVPADELTEESEARLYAAAEKRSVIHGARGLPLILTGAINQIEAAYKSPGGMAGLPTGLGALDTILGGLQPADLIIVAGRPGMGKTALATDIALNVAIGGPETVLFFSLEMSGEQLGMRLLAQQTGISAHALRAGGSLRDEDFVLLVKATQDLERARIFTDDTPALTIGQVHGRSRRMKRTEGLDLIVVDYLQLLQPNQSRRNDNRVQDVTAITQGLKALAKDIDVPVIALSQLSRAVESREDKRPQLSDLRESGSIEQDADVVMFVYRESYYLRDEPIQKEKETDIDFADRCGRWRQRLDDVEGKAELIVAKQRHGPIDTAKVAFNARLTQFSNLNQKLL